MIPLVRNSIFMTLFNIFGRASGFIRYILLVGFLTELNFGIITFAFSFGRIGRHFMDGGLDNLISRDGARNYEKIPLFYIHGLVIKFTLAVLFFSGSFVYLHYFRQLPFYEMLVVYVALIGSAMLSFTGVIRSCFTAIEQMQFIFYTNLPVRLFSIILLFLALWFSLPLAFAAGAVSIENLLWLLLLGGLSLRFFSISNLRFSFSVVRSMLAESWPLAAYGFFNIFYLSLDVLMIEYIMGDRIHVAPYTYASQLLEGVTMLITGYLIAIFPVLSRLHNTDEAAYQRLFHQSVVLLLGCTIPVSVLLGLWSHEWMNLIKETGSISGKVLGILSVNLNLSLLNTLMIAVFTSRNRQRWLVLFTGMAVIISFISNWFLIPIYAQPGGAYATLFSQFVLFITMVSIGKSLFTLQFTLLKPLLILFLSMISGLIIRIIPGIPLLLIPFLYVGLLAGLIHVTGVFSKEEIQRFIKAFKR